MEQAIPRGYSSSPNSPPGFTVALKSPPITFMKDSLFTGNLLKAPPTPTGLGG
jgi:hypothetical protein